VRTARGAATLILNRPEKCNALTKDVFEALDEHLDAIAREVRTVGLVILRGANGKTFPLAMTWRRYSSTSALAPSRITTRSHRKMANLPQPVISAVQGHCSTGALELALAADLIVASESAQFCDAYAKWGLTPIWG